MKPILTFFASCFFLLHATAQWQPLTILKDINPSGSSNPRDFVEINGISYFNAYDITHGAELWRTDGTAAGTYLVKDIYPGTSSGYASFYPVKLNNRVFFVGTTAEYGSELWSSDGTEAGTSMAKDIYPGTGGSNIFQTTVYNNKVYFVASSPDYGDELWSSDGTAAGTQLVKDITPGTGSSSIYSTQMKVVNDKLVFSANDGTNGYRLWVTDGTAAGTKILSMAVNVNGLVPAAAVMNDNIYYAATTAGGAAQLWKSNGTETGTSLVKDIPAGVSVFTTVGNNVFFRAGAAELWKTNGTAGGTILVKNMGPLSVNGIFSPQNLYAYDNNTLLFMCNYTFSVQTNPYGCELWKSDGTDAGTSLVRSFQELSGTAIFPNSFTKYNGNYYFMAYKSGGVYYELWKTDATPAGTATVRSTTKYDGSYPTTIRVANGLLYYTTWGERGSNFYGIWQSDGTEAGTQKITQTDAGSTDRPSALIVMPDKAIMVANAADNINFIYYGNEPFVTDIPAKPACTQFQTPTISITSGISGSVCPGTPNVFNATITNGGTVPQFQWKKNNVNISWATGSTFSISSLNNNDTISCVLTSNADCITANTAVSNKIIVSVLAPPSPKITAGGPTTFCQGDSVILTSSSASSYLWSNGATKKSITVKTTGSYSVTVTNASGCKGTSAAKVVTVNALPSASISADGLTTFCAGGSVTLTSSSASSYLWSNGATSQSILVNATGNYNVAVTNASGCSASATPVSVTVNTLPTPIITANGPTTFCAGGSVELSTSPAAGYTWYNEQNQPVWYQQNFSATTAGNYHVTVLDGNGCEGTSASQVVTTNPLPEPIITASGPTTFCQGGSVKLNAPNGYTSYLWSNGAATKSITVNANGFYSVTVTNANGCSGSSQSINVIVNSLPAAIITASGPTSFCQGGNVKLTAYSASSYLWSNGTSTKTITVNTSGNYTVTVTNSSTGCSATSAATVVTVNPLPIPTITASGPLEFCEGGNVVLTSSSASSYLWSNGATSKSITVNAAGNYSVQVTNNGCTGTSAVTKVIVNPIPQPVITTSGSTTLCQGDDVKLTSSVGGIYLWNNGATTKTITVNTAGSYSITVTANGCSGTSPAKQVIVNPLPTPVVTASGPVINLCPGTTVVLSADAGYKNYLWSNGAVTKSINVSAAGSYYVTVTNANNCSGNSAVTKVTYLTCPAPKSLKVTLVSGTGATFTWAAALCSAGYKLQYKPVGASSWTTVSLVSNTYNVTGLTPATAYQWQVATICQNSPLIMSAYTAGNNFTTPAASFNTSPNKQNSNFFTARIVPNPALSKAVLYISGAAQKINISITDVAGRIIWKRLNVQESEVSLPVENLANGMYFISITNNAETKVLKLIKQ